MTDKVAVVGLGFVGLTLALFLAEKSKYVVGFDLDKSKIDDLRANKTYFHENGLNELLDAHLDRNFFPNSLEDETGVYDWIIVTVGTPLKYNKPNMSYLFDTLNFVASKASHNAEIILRSTVPIGITRQYAELLENIRPDLNVSFCPERTVEGKAIQELQELPQIVSSIRAERSGKVRKFFNEIDVETINLDSTEEAELVKLFSNVYRDLHFSIANLFDEVASELNLSGSSVIDAANFSYDRNNIPNPGFVAGPCLSKDAQLLASSVQSDILKNYALVGRTLNGIRVGRFVEETLKSLGSSGSVLLYGLAFKGWPETDDIRDSQAIDFFHKLRNSNHLASVYLFDPIASDEQIMSYFHGGVIFEGQRVDVVVRLNNHPSFESWMSNNHHILNENAKIIDTWK